jgi:hypothetical protein
MSHTRPEITGRGCNTTDDIAQREIDRSPDELATPDQSTEPVEVTPEQSAEAEQDAEPVEVITSTVELEPAPAEMSPIPRRPVRRGPPGAMARREAKRRAAERQAREAEATEMFTVAEFCRKHSLHKSTFYVLRAQGLGPAEIRLGRRSYITREAAEEWRQQRQAASA